MVKRYSYLHWLLLIIIMAITINYAYATNLLIKVFSSGAVGEGFTNKFPVWDVARRNITGDIATSNGTVFLHSYVTTGNFTIRRVFLSFNTSTLPDDATITAASLIINITNVLNTQNTGDRRMIVVKANQSDSNISNFTVSNYRNFGYDNLTAGGNSSAVTANTSYVIPLNITGWGWINLTGMTKFAILASQDAYNSTPIDTSSETYYSINTQVIGSSYTQLNVTYNQPDNCSCPVPIGNWTFQYGTTCLLTTNCSLGNNSVYINNGKLILAPNVRLTCKKIVVSKTNGGFIVPIINSFFGGKIGGMAK